MSHSLPVPLPSGLHLEIRRLKTAELDLMSDPNTARNPETINRVLDSCVVSLIEVPAFYDFRDGKQEERFKAAKLLVGDRMALTYFLRRWTYGDIIEFDWTCPECRQPNRQEGDLSDLSVQSLPEKSKEVLSRDGIFRTKLPEGGQDVGFRLLYGHDEPRLQRLRKQSTANLMSAVLAYRMVEINGHKPSSGEISDLEAFDVSWLLKHFEEVDCGIQTEAEVTCSHCAGSTKMDLPFGGKGFWSAPKRLLRRLGKPEGEAGPTS